MVYALDSIEFQHIFIPSYRRDNRWNLNMEMANITFKKLVEKDYDNFRKDVKEIFSIAVIETFEKPDDPDGIIPDSDINTSRYNPECEVLVIYADGEKAGGVVVKPDPKTRINWLDIFYIYPDRQSKGLGRWMTREQVIEKYSVSYGWFYSTLKKARGKN